MRKRRKTKTRMRIKINSTKIMMMTKVNAGDKSVEKGSKQVYTFTDGKEVENIADIAEALNKLIYLHQSSYLPIIEMNQVTRHLLLSPLIQKLIELGG
ncbi:hypothetical protein L1987_21360 [Smallanthus sonchifolius]|uniref:Uncharacterized protein n=1 Tax=Smallanthus sonchifolius TaxID=185202 RepID=A0ACB9IUD4_9ASTR|nr:hypothetical protein L1987_21360 [Smallanthus sonchifolius]